MDHPTLKNLTSRNYGIPPEAQNQVIVLKIEYLLSLISESWLVYKKLINVCYSFQKNWESLI